MKINGAYGNINAQKEKTRCTKIVVQNVHFEKGVNMEELLYQPKDAWVGDLIPYYDGGMFYAFYLHDPRKNPKEYAEETTWHLVKTKDFVNLEYKGEAIKRGGEKERRKGRRRRKKEKKEEKKREGREGREGKGGGGKKGKRKDRTYRCASTFFGGGYAFPFGYG